MKALIYRRGGLGDTLLVFPILEILKGKDYEITAVGNTDYFSLAKEVGWADRILSEIPEGEFDLEVIISTDGNVKPFPDRRVWVLEHYLDSLGMRGEPFSDILPLRPLPNSPFKGKVVIHPSSGSRKKNADISLFLELEEFLRGRGCEVAYLVGEADGWVKEKLGEFVESYDPLWIAKALKGALLYIGLDSGISHLSSYLGLPTIVIYGPTDPTVWRPVGRRVYQVSLELECSPCFPDVCEERDCLDRGLLSQRLLPLLDHLLIKVNENDLP